MGKKKMVDVSVMVDDDHKDNVAAVARGLKAKGFVLNESLEAIGVLTGSAPATSIASLSGVDGVSSVEENRTDYHVQQ